MTNEQRLTLEAVIGAIAADPDPVARAAAVDEVRALLHGVHPNKGQPIDRVLWVPIEKVSPNDYNPLNSNSVPGRM